MQNFPDKIPIGVLSRIFLYNTPTPKVMKVESQFYLKALQKNLKFIYKVSNMTYAHVLNRGGKAVRSPLDFYFPTI